jgi:hypothetical protein
MSVQVPDWLARRGGGVKLSGDKSKWFVLLNNHPQYSLAPAPVHGKFGCTILQTINGKRLPSASTFATPEEALQGGLEDLRKALGW